jgi:condensin complex subunit 3
VTHYQVPDTLLIVSPVVTMPARARSPEDLTDSLAESLPPIFNQAQLSLANHRKNVAVLHASFIESSKLTAASEDGRTVLAGERAFVETLKGMVNRVLDVKKGVVQADRVLRFVASFVSFAVDKGARLSLRA